MSIEKLDLSTPDFTDANAARIAELFPSVVTEGRDEHGKLRRIIDFDALKQELSADIVEGPPERYHLNWPGKREAMREANRPIDKTLRPVRGESVDFDTTRNLFIEGDNLDALKLLQETYLGKIKMIYIDPPYNTGKDFIYRDNFTGDKREHEEASGQRDEDGGKLVANPESNGRYHSDWLSMMYPRLKLARNLLREDGVIFISIDDNEQAALKKICDEIFGEDNFVANVVWQKKYAVSSDDPGIADMHDHILVFRRSDIFSRNLLPRTKEQEERYKNADNDPRGPWSSDNYISNNSKADRPTLYYPIKHPLTGEDVWPGENAWRYSKEKHEKMVAEDRLYWGPTQNYDRPRMKRFLSEIQDGVVPSTWWPHTTFGHNDEASKETNNLFGVKKVFTFPKPVRLIKEIARIGSNNDSIILDFFSGSSSTAHAVMALNVEEKATRSCISVQLPEGLDAKSVGIELGYSTIADISKERIRRAGTKILEEKPELKGKLDIGFRVLKIDSSNMVDVRRAAADTTQGDLMALVDNIKPDRTDEDLLFQVLLNWGVDLTLPIAREKLANKGVYFVAENALAACFDKGVGDELVKAIAARKPLRAVFRDDAFADDATRINAEQLFKQLSPGTELRVI